MQFENFQSHEYLLFTNCTRRSCDFLFFSTVNKITSFPWKLNRYSYGVQFGINCTALDQSKLSNFVECTISENIATKAILFFFGCSEVNSLANHLRASQSACAKSTIHLCGIY